LEPGRRYTVTVRLNGIAHTLPAGHRWRVAVSPTYWPHAWPSPEPVTLTLFTGRDSQLRLPVRPPQAQDDDIRPFDLPENSPMLARTSLRSSTRRRTAQYDPIQGSCTLQDHSDGGRQRLIASGLEFESLTTNTYSIKEDDPLSAAVRCDHTIRLGRGDWRVRLETYSLMTADAENFHVTNMLDAYEGNSRVFSKSWTFKVARDLV
jgi:hypothetical protein